MEVRCSWLITAAANPHTARPSSVPRAPFEAAALYAQELAKTPHGPVVAPLVYDSTDEMLRTTIYATERPAGRGQGRLL